MKKRPFGRLSAFLPPAAFLLVIALLISPGCGGSDQTPEIESRTGITEDKETEAVPERVPEENPMQQPAAEETTKDVSPSSEILMPPTDASDETDEQEESPGSGFKMPEVPASGAESGASASESPAVRLATWQEVLANIESTERITVVDLWALSCAPCLKEFPGLVQLDQQLGESVRCIGVDVDFDGRKTRPPESYQPRVKEFLASVDAQFENYISQTPSDEVFESVGVASIPAVLVYDAQGNLVKQFADVGETAGFTYQADVIPLVKQLAG